MDMHTLVKSLQVEEIKHDKKIEITRACVRFTQSGTGSSVCLCERF